MSALITYNSLTKHRGIETGLRFKENEELWFSAAPQFTTVRINTPLTSVDEVVAIIKDSLAKDAQKRGKPVPVVYQHSDFLDCLVIPPWQKEVPQPRHDIEVVVDAACGVAVLRGAHVFAPGVLGLLPCVEEGDVVSVYADTSGSCRRGLTVPFTDPNRLFVGNGIMKMSRKQLFEKDLHPKGVAVEMTESASGVASASIPQHLGLLQNLPSILCGHVVAPRPGEKVVDLCAAPGHKTTHLAALMNNTGMLIALDKISRKVEALRSLCQTMGLDCVKAFAWDSTKSVASASGSDWSPPYAPDTFDRVLLDAPCSATGQRPRICKNISVNQIESYPKLQKKLFVNAVELVRPGGCLVYSTCSLTTAENEDIVSWALEKFPQLSLVPASPYLGKPGITQGSLSEMDCQKVQRFGPPVGPQPEDDTIGFFIAKFVKSV